MPSKQRCAPGQLAHYRVLKSLDNVAIRVRLTVPPPADMCPFSLSPVADDALDFLPAMTFLESLPQVKQITLPCGHAFGALNLLYHFARRNMLCPCCRKGSSSTINPKYIPRHLRPAIVARVAHELHQERAEQVGEDWALASQEANQPSLWAALVDRVQMSVYPHISLEDIPFVSFEFQLNHDSDRLLLPAPSPVIFELSADDSRAISSHLRDLAVTQISLVVHARSVTDRVVQLARTDAFDVLGPATGPRTVDGGDSHFAVCPAESPGFSALKWIAPAGLLHALLH